ncbi:SDR family oxidoreductase [Cytobacillus oceanisediminis]|uniref:UDP-glucuronic acid decarboxylase family protein n=1 Tax=Cytobacillus oceanisediminis TaxID=665099 RepID=UPI0023DB0E81|nr:UDP-glucuronic acid decarboxylase family protein [Cytobacillus oceanisediminis]MDF2035797.1 SDR family oxidoreductase [Cytobacillus oceanisediminis]
MGKILISGAAGFLGSHLANELLRKGKYVIGVDNLSTGQETNLKELRKQHNFTFLNFNICDKEILKIKELGDVTEIYHLASPASPKFYQAFSMDTIEVNTLGTKNLLDLAKKNGAKFLFTSTSEAYGDPEVHPQSEDYRGNVNTWGPRACYDESKRLGEVYCYEYFYKFNVQVKVVRIFNTYSAGLRNDDGRVISNFVLQALAGENITVYGDGSQTRSFCYVDDMIRGLQLTMKTEKANGQIINLGNPDEIAILELAEKIKKLTNSQSRIVFHSLPDDDPKVRRPNIDKAKDILGWNPLIDLEEGLKRTIQVYKTRL